LAEVKGTMVKGWLNFLKERYGESKVSSAIEKLDPSDRSTLISPILDSSWYPLELQSALSKLTRTLRSALDRDVATQLGRYMAEYAYTRVYANQLMDGPIKQGQSFGWVDKLLYQGLRKCEPEVTGPSSLVVRYYYERGIKPGEGECTSIAGFIARQMEMTGAFNVKCSHPKCLATGTARDCCEFGVKWELDSKKAS
jgi:hypothetical protein